MLAVTGAIKGAGSGQGRPAAHRRALLRRHQGLCVGHVAPEAAHGGPIALVRDGDPIVLDMARRELNLQVDAEELARRRQEWKAPERPLRGVLAKYARLVGSAADGAICG